MTRAVPRGPDPFCHGISANVDMSGIRYWSDSAIRVNPSMDEPSNHVPCLTEPSSWWIGIVTAFTWPMTSVNWSWMNRMPLSFAASIFAIASVSASATANGTSFRFASVEDVDGQGDDESERRDHPGHFAGVPICLRHHGVGEHRQDGTPGECEYECDDLRRGAGECGVADQCGERRHQRDD